MSLLVLDRLQVRHGLLVAVHDASLDVAAEEIVALVGANGAGKSSLLRAVAGSYRATAGRIVLDGVDVTEMPAYRRLKEGIALVPEGRRLFREMTVNDNLLVAAGNARSGPWEIERVVQAFPLLARLRNRLAGNLSGGEQQAVAIGRALVTNPRVLLLDEVSLGLAPVVVDEVYVSLRAVLAEGATTVVLVEQDLVRALEVSTRVVCMLEGRVVLDQPTGEVTQERVTAAYFGLHERADSPPADHVGHVVDGGYSS